MSDEDELLEAQQVVKAGPRSLSRGFAPVDNVRVFTELERDQLQSLRDLIERYVELSEPPRPLCLGVFGPPGSGKSFGIKQIVSALGKRKPPIALSFHELNLTQIPSTEALATEMVSCRERTAVDEVPLFFFDEFDAPLDGKPLGWLSWLLAPMHDGHFLENRRKIALHRAIFVFAGGTADTLEDFQATPAETFRAAKGPDFVSRLRGFLDVCGPNHPEGTALRRAIVLHFALKDVDKARGARSAAPVQLSDELSQDLLRVGRFRHGARSLGAIVEMTAARAGLDVRELGREHLPDDHLLALHADRGPLDILAIGGLIGISGGGEKDVDRAEALKKVAKELVRRGASLAYGGNPMLDDLVQTLIALDPPRRLTRLQSEDGSVPEGERRLVLFPLNDEMLEHMAPESHRFDVVAPPPNGDLSGMRWRQSCRCVARVLIGGRAEGYEGHLPGIFEEASMALLQGRPLYILGGFDGATASLGALLGMARSNTSPIVPPDDPPQAPTPPRGASELPTDIDAAKAWLPGFAIGGAAWPDNGLTVEENLELFASRDVDRIKALVVRGLERRFR